MANEPHDLDLIPAIAPAKDEVASYRRNARSEVPKQSNFQGLLVFALVLMAIMIGVGGFALFEVQKRLEQSNALLAQGQSSIRDLDDRLAATGTDVSKTLQDMKAQQATNVTEIDKLWAIAYRQNRPLLQKLERTIAELVETDKKLDAQMANQVASINTVSERFDELSSRLLEDNEEVTTSMALLRGSLQDQAVIVEAGRRSVLSLEVKLKETEEAIAAIDRFRQQTNQRLLDLQRQMQAPTGP